MNNLPNEEFSVDTILNSYLKKCYSPRTAMCYLSDINIYLSSFPNAETAQNKDIMNCLTAIRKRYTNPKTLTKFLSSIKAYYQFLTETGKRNDNPAQSIYLKDKLNTAIQLQDLFTSEELGNLFTVHQTKNYLSDSLKQRDEVILTLLIYQALQISELESLNIEDINLKEGTINIKQTLRTNQRTLTLKPQQILLFQFYINEIRPSLSKQNPTSTNSFLLSQSGIKHDKAEISRLITTSFQGLYQPRKLSAQTIRQSVIMNLLKDAHDVRVVQVFAGHKNPNTTERYNQANMEELRTAILSFHPFS
mgnify:CR=1 FL=1|jgi:integrase/recombinase XerD